MPELDDTDRRIINILALDGRASDVSLGEQIHLSSTAICRRRRNLEDSGIIKDYSANLDMKALAFGVKIFISIELQSHADNMMGEFEGAILQCPSVSFCALVSGDTYLVAVNVRSIEDYDAIYRKELSAIPHISRIESNIMLREVANRKAAPIA
jgi:DNA-binding Lrp family transcriptional regulator